MRHTFMLSAVLAALSGAALAAYDLPVRKLESAVSVGKYQDRILPQGTGTSVVLSTTPRLTVAQR